MLNQKKIFTSTIVTLMFSISVLAQDDVKINFARDICNDIEVSSDEARQECRKKSQEWADQGYTFQALGQKICIGEDSFTVSARGAVSCLTKAAERLAFYVPDDRSKLLLSESKDCENKEESEHATQNKVINCQKEAFSKFNKVLHESDLDENKSKSRPSERKTSKKSSK